MSDDDAFRDALRDLIPDYTGPVDPVPRVIATVRRRRGRRRTLLAVGGTGLAVVLALAAPALLLPGHGGGGGGVRAAAPHRPDGPPAPSASGDVGRPPPASPPIYPVADGHLTGAAWAIGTTTLSPGARRCLISNDDVSDMQVDCFEDWRAGAPVTWSARPLSDKGPTVTRIVGVAPARTATVEVRLRTGTQLTLVARATPTDRDGRFFGVVLPGTVTVLDVTALDAAGRDLGPPVARPAVACHPDPTTLCAPPK